MLRLEEQVNATSKGPQAMSVHGLHRRGRSPQSDVAADETVAVAVTGAVVKA